MCLAFLPQMGQVSPRSSCAKGMQREVMPACSFIFISHKMTEIFTIANRYTVLRNGQMIRSGEIAEITPTEVTKLMVGNSYSDSDIYTPRELGDPILELENYSGHGFENINLSIRRGEVVGFTGLKGAGVSELMQTIYTAADLFLFPSIYDNAPLVVREAASLFTPSIVARGSNTAEIIQNGINGFLSDNDVTAFANRLRYILERPTVISWAAKGAAETLVRPWEDIAVEVLDRYQHLIDRQQNRLAI